MKKKIRRAFDSTKPNILDRVLEDCSPRTVVAEPKRKRLSDKAVQRLAAAASFVLLIGAAIGGSLYFRDYFAGQGVSGVQSPVASNAVPSVDIDGYTPIDGVPITADFAAEIALEEAKNSYSSCVVYDCRPENSSCYRVYITCAHPFPGQYPDTHTPLICIQYLVDAISGDFIISDQFEMDFNEMNILDEEHARSAALAQAEAMYGTGCVISCDHFFRSGLMSYYSVAVLADTEEGIKTVQYAVEECMYYKTDASPDIPPDMIPTRSDVRDIVLRMQSHGMKNVRCLKIAEESDCYSVYYELGENAYTFHIDFDGNVLYDSGAEYAGLRVDEKMEHLIGWQKARDIALAACGREVVDMVGFTYEYAPGDPDSYHMELYFEDDAFTFRIDALDGTLLESPVVEPAPPDGAIGSEWAIHFAMDYTGHLEDYIAGTITDISCKLDTANTPNRYWVYYQAGSDSYEVAVHAYNGEILECNGYGIDEPVLDGITQDQAIEIALEYCGVAADKAISLQCRFVDTELESCYRVSFYNSDFQYEVYVHPYTGEVLGCQGTPIACTYTKEDAVQAARGALPNPNREFALVECHQLGTESNRIIYMVIFRDDMTITVMVDGNTLRIMDSGAHNLEGILPDEEIREIAYRAFNLEDEQPMQTVMTGVYNDGTPFCCAKIYYREVLYVAVMNAYTGEILLREKFEIPRLPGHIISADQALEYALANVCISMADAIDPTIIHDADKQTYTVCFGYQGTEYCSYTVIVDDYFGTIIDYYYTVSE